MKPETEQNATTEQKIKDAARRVFTQKGYAATRTRDIAEESGFNLALINYYFRSKEKLFDIIMMEQLQIFAGTITGVLDDHTTTIHQKLTELISKYIDMLVATPGLPFFIMNEVNADPEKFISKMGIAERNKDLYAFRQWKEMADSGKLPNIKPMHIFLNLVSMTVFPFIASPLLKVTTGMSHDDFNLLMEERKKLIPQWIAAILQVSNT